MTSFSERTAPADDREDGQDGQHKMNPSMTPPNISDEVPGMEGMSSSGANSGGTAQAPKSDNHNHSEKED